MRLLTRTILTAIAIAFTSMPSGAMDSPAEVVPSECQGDHGEVLKDTRSQGLQAYRHMVGKTLQMAVTGATMWSIWGDGVYADDSAVGVAAVHAGLLSKGEKGVVTIELLPGREAIGEGRPTFEGSTQHGVTSNPGHPNGWGGSYRFVLGCSARKS